MRSCSPPNPKADSQSHRNAELWGANQPSAWRRQFSLPSRTHHTARENYKSNSLCWSESRVYAASQKTRYQRDATIHYCCHPGLGQTFDVVREYRHDGRLFLEIALDGEHQLIPEWMTDDAYCARLLQVRGLCGSVVGLRQLRHLLSRLAAVSEFSHNLASSQCQATGQIPVKTAVNSNEAVRYGPSPPGGSGSHATHRVAPPSCEVPRGDAVESLPRAGKRQRS